MLIQLANSQHAQDISDLDVELFDNGFNHYTIQQEIECGVGLVVYEDARLLGYALVRTGALNDLLRIGVCPTARRLGHGGRLLDAALSMVHGRMMLTVRKNNKIAQRLYRARGFKICAQIDTDNWVMIR